MKYKKGQTGFQAVTIAIVITAILLLIAVVIFSKFAGSTETLIDNDAGTNFNESVAGAVNLSLNLANQQETCALVSVYNATPDAAPALTSGNYTFDGTACTINMTCGTEDCMDTETTVSVLVTYTYFNTSDFTTTFRGMRSTTLDAFDLVVIGLIILAAGAILSVLFLLGRGGR